MGSEWSRLETVDILHLLKLSQAQLDELYRAAPAGDIPRGEGQGTLLVAPGTKLSRVAARFVRDEIREIAPNLYLGIAYLDRIKIANFALSFPT
jgi:hypothetical protein